MNPYEEVTVTLTVADLGRIDTAFAVSERESYVEDDERLTWRKIVNAEHRALGKPETNELPSRYKNARPASEFGSAPAVAPPVPGLTTSTTPTRLTETEALA